MGTRSRPYQSKGFQPNGLLPNETTLVVGPIDPEGWTKAEEQTAELISCIQPNWSSENQRNAVASYVQNLITKCVPCKVFTFGSVPLKTYLPDGDIDLTVFSEDHNLKDNWADEVRDMLEKEEKNEHAEFQVKEVQYIQAEVRIIKCLVDNIVVDISFNQLGGLCTLCFLEEVDNLINQNHLFKRSIILIKAWCYYESRILGAHHGLISTYALETLVLYTFHVFNNSFAGPLEVLYRFLEFFSKFDWTNFCVSLWGPVPISSLPDMTANPPRKDGGDLLFNRMFLSACSTAYSVFPAGQETQEQPFVTKHFNVIDPLRINNNLGRSVSKGNFYRIRSAFSFGAEQLAKIFECQQLNIEDAVNHFFVNTWDRHGKRHCPDAHIADASFLRQIESESGGNLNIGIFSANNAARTADGLKDVHAHKQKDYDDSTGDHYSQRHDLTKIPENGEESCRKNILPNKGHSKHQLARTYSSPELANMSNEASSEYISNVAQENMEKDIRWTRDPCTLENRVVEYATNKSSAGNSIVGLMPPVYPGGDDTQQEQDVVNLMLSSGIQNYGRHVHMPVNLSSHQLFQIPPSALGYSHQIFAGTIPAYSIDSDWGSVMHHSDGPPFPKHSDGPPFPKHFNTVGVSTDQANLMGKLNGNAVFTEVGHQDHDSGFLIDKNVDSIKEIDTANEVFSTASSTLSPGSPATSSRTMASSESSWDGKPTKMTIAVKHRLGKKTNGSCNTIVSDNSEWQGDLECVDQNYSNVDDDCKEWIPLSTAESVASSVTSSLVEAHQLPELGSVQMSYPTSVLPFAPVLVRSGSQQGLTNNHGMVAFYPAGPPVPFVTMVPFVTIPTERGTSNTHSSQHEMEIAKPNFPVLQTGHNSYSEKDPEQLRNTDHHHSEERTTYGEHSCEGRSDIFNSDFASHWKNLQYGRLCQISQLQHHFMYPHSVVVSPQYLQGELHFNGVKKPSPRSANIFAQVVPFSAQRGSSKPSGGVSRQFSGDVSKNRNGTGTYFPNPKVLRDRQFSTSRQYRWEHNYDRSEHHGDREANWNFSKPRSTGRMQARYSYEKLNTSQQNSNRSNRSSNGPFISKPEQHFVGSNGHESHGYWRRGDNQLPNYHGDLEPPSPDFASPPKFPGADGV